MTEDEYKDFVTQAHSGALLIGVDRAVARKFYTDLPLSQIEEETGEAPYFEKIVIWIAFLGAPIGLFTSFVLSVFAFRWWAIPVIAISAVVYFLFSGQSSMLHRGMLGISILLALAIFGLFTNFSSKLMRWYFVTVVFALWASRLVYCEANRHALCFCFEESMGANLCGNASR